MHTSALHKSVRKSRQTINNDQITELTVAKIQRSRARSERDREGAEGNGTYLVCDEPMIRELGSPPDVDPVVLSILLPNKLLDRVE